MHPARLDSERFVAELHFEYARASGPGGQHRNKVETAVRVTHRPTGIRCHASERRSMQMNKSKAVKRLRLKLAIEHREPIDPAALPPPGVYEPSELWRSRLQGTKMICSASHEDFPALLAESLDLIDHFESDLSRAATLLRVSTAQLVKFIAKDLTALGRVNEQRRARGLRPFRA